MGIKFSFGSESGVINKKGTISCNGFGSMTLVPSGSAINFVTLFTDVWRQYYEADYVDTSELNNKVNDAVEEVHTLLEDYTTTETLSEFINDLGVTASVEEALGSYVTKDGDAAAMASITVDANGIIGGVEIGALSTETTELSYVDVRADAFRVYSADDAVSVDGAGDPMPVFSVYTSDDDVVNTVFNGKVVFNSLIDDYGQTIIDGGTIITDYINADEVVTGTNLVPTQFGHFPVTLSDDVEYTYPSDDYIQQAIVDLLLPKGTTVNYGDVYTTDSYSYEYGLSGWAETTAKAKDEIAGKIGYSSYSAMVDAASDGNTIINGGYLRTSLIDVDTLLVKNVFDPYGDDFEIRSDGSAGPDNDSHIYGTSIRGATGLFKSTYGVEVVDNLDAVLGVSATDGNSTDRAFIVSSDIDDQSAVYIKNVNGGNGMYISSDASSAIQVYSHSDANYGVYSYSSSGHAIYGKSGDDGFGVGGYSSGSWTATHGTNSSSGYGGGFTSSSGNGIYGVTYGDAGKCGVYGRTDDDSNEWGVLTYDKIKAKAYESFTGAHETFTGNKELVVGDIVSTVFAFGTNVNQSYTEVVTTTVAKDRTIYGVCSSIKDDMEEWAKTDPDVNVITYEQVEVLDEEGNSLDPQEFVDDISNPIYTPIPEYKEYLDKKIEDGYVRLSANAIGEGMMNMCDANGDIECGDYICSSEVAGKGMKQDDDLLHNYTVGKSLVNIVWDDEVVGETCEELDGHKWKMAPCTYHCS